MILRTLIAFALAVLLVAGAALGYHRRRSTTLRLILFAALCSWVVAAAHVCEAFGLLPGAGWGQPQSVGHYIDLGAAVLGLTLLGAAAFRFLWPRAHL